MFVVEETKIVTVEEIEIVIVEETQKIVVVEEPKKNIVVEEIQIVCGKRNNVVIELKSVILNQKCENFLIKVSVAKRKMKYNKINDRWSPLYRHTSFCINKYTSLRFGT